MRPTAALLALVIGCGSAAPSAPPAPEPSPAERQRIEVERNRRLSDMLVMLLAKLDAEARMVPADSMEAADLRQRKADALAALAVVRARLASPRGE